LDKRVSVWKTSVWWVLKEREVISNECDCVSKREKGKLVESRRKGNGGNEGLGIFSKTVAVGPMRVLRVSQPPLHSISVDSQKTRWDLNFRRVVLRTVNKLTRGKRMSRGQRRPHDHPALYCNLLREKFLGSKVRLSLAWPGVKR
jgi:hypothetical protein